MVTLNVLGIGSSRHFTDGKNTAFTKRIGDVENWISATLTKR